MKLKKYVVSTIFLVLLAHTCLRSCTFIPSSDNTVLGTLRDSHESCSVLSASCGENVLFGGNCDIDSLLSFEETLDIELWPASEEGYGFIVLGWTRREGGIFHSSGQGMMNEQGLVCGANGLPSIPLNPHPEKPFSGPETFSIKAMRECSDVCCVIEIANNFDWGSSSCALQQRHFADSAGDAVVISAGPDGELAFTRKEKDTYLVSTNFNRAYPKNGTYPCWRYITATTMLDSAECEGDLTVSHVKSVLDAIHQEGLLLNTVYSFIFDLRHGDIYVYYLHQFDEVVQLNISQELTGLPRGGFRGIDLSDYFSYETRNEARSEVQEYQRKFLVTLAFGVAILSVINFWIYRKLKDHLRKKH